MKNEETVRRITITNTAEMAAALDMYTHLPLNKQRRLKGKVVFENLTLEESQALLGALDCPASWGYGNTFLGDSQNQSYAIERSAMAALRKAQWAVAEVFGEEATNSRVCSRVLSDREEGERQ